MAVQAQNPNQLLEFLQAIKRRLGQVFAPAAVLTAIAVLLAGLMPQKYKATTSLEVRDVPLPFSGTRMDSTTIVRDITATTWQILQYERVRRVVEKLEWPEYTALSPQEQNEFVRKQITALRVTGGSTTAKTTGGSTLITVTYETDDPQRAEQFLNRLRDAYTQEVLERYREDARRNLTVLRNTMSAAQEDLKRRNEEAAAFQRDYAISSTQQAPGGGRQRDEDPVYTRLQASITRLDDIRAQITTGNVGLEVLRKQLGDEPMTIVGDSILDTGIRFDDELTRIETEIADLRESQRPYKEISTAYQIAERKIEILQQKAQELSQRATAPESRSTMRPNPRREQIANDIAARELLVKQAEAQLEQLSSEVASLRRQNAERAEIYSQLKEIEARATIAADNFQRASEAFQSQKRYVDQITEGTSSPFEITELARAPTAPSTPSSAIVIAAGAILGLGMGLLWALASEFGRNGFRGVADSSRALAVPVLGIVNRIRTRRERNADYARRLVASFATLAIVASILWVSWAFEKRPQLLGASLVRTMTDLKEALR